MQFGKLVALRISNESLSDDPLPLTLDTKRAADILCKFSLDLQDLWAQYPQWPTAALDWMLDAWQNLARAHGYWFTQSNGGDSLWIQ